jgi:FKBP-type peptidyl-prolyl cis-trans isomerase FkpA
MWRASAKLLGIFLTVMTTAAYRVASSGRRGISRFHLSVLNTGRVADALHGVTEFEQEGPNEEELEKIMYVLGLNMASQLPADLKQLLAVDELRTVMQGVSDLMLGEADEPQRQLAEYGEQVNTLVQDRARILVSKAAEAGLKVLKDAKKDSAATTTSGGVVVVPLNKGVGQFPTAASSVQVHYTGALADGTVFDSSVARGEPATFALKQVIKGWQEGLQEMQEGGKARLVIPSDLG